MELFVGVDREPDASGGQETLFGVPSHGQINTDCVFILEHWKI